MRDYYIQINGFKIRYKKANELAQRKVVLLHGMAFSADTWEELSTITKLSREGFGVYAIDVPGFGKSSGRRMNRWKVAEILNNVLDNLGVDKVFLVGPSMGGGIALAFGILYPYRLVGMALIAPAGLNDERVIESLNKLEMPIIIFWGENDRVFPLDKAYYLKNRLKNAELVICPKARHPCYLDIPDLFHKKLLNFLNKIFET